MNEENYDVVIIGAGLAGLSAAEEICFNNTFKFALIEGKCVGSNNPSPLTFPDIVVDFGLSDCIKSKYFNFGFHNYKGSQLNFIFNEPLLVVLDYKKACEKIFKRIKNKQPNMEFIEQFAVDIRKEEELSTIVLKNGRCLRTKILIDASGKNQFAVLKYGTAQSKFYSHVYGGEFYSVTYREKDACCFLWPHEEFGLGGGWFYALGESRASFGYASISNSVIPDIPELKKYFNAAREKFLPYSEYLKDARIDNIECGSIPITYEKEMVFKNVIIVGDAAGMATNWTCMGVEPALKYGKIAGELAVKALSGNDISILMDFQKIWEQENKNRYDDMSEKASSFWVHNYDLWEWITKNDLAFLTAKQMISRLRVNGYVSSKYVYALRHMLVKIRSIFNKDVFSPKNILIKK